MHMGIDLSCKTLGHCVIFIDKMKKEIQIRDLGVKFGEKYILLYCKPFLDNTFPR
jgi:hypothetical protein